MLEAQCVRPNVVHHDQHENTKMIILQENFGRSYFRCMKYITAMPASMKAKISRDRISVCVDIC